MEGLAPALRTNNPFNSKVIILNCQSLFPKKDIFSYFTSDYNPKFIIGSESWLTDSILNSEVFPPNYTVFRRDRPSGHGGGVFLACKQKIDCKQIDFDTECELVACEIELPNSSPLIIVALYQPPYNDAEYMEKLCNSLNHIITITSYPLSLCNIFLDFMVHHGVVQMNLQPTRCNSILDVFLTSVQSDMSVKNLPTIKRKIYLCTKADFSTINYLIADFTTTFLNHPIDTPVQ